MFTRNHKLLFIVFNFVFSSLSQAYALLVTPNRFFEEITLAEFKTEVFARMFFYKNADHFIQMDYFQSEIFQLNPVTNGKPAKKRPRHRTVIPGETLALLIAIFAQIPRPDGATKNAISFITTLPVPAIANWFQNRRDQGKKKAKSEKAELSGTCCGVEASGPWPYPIAAPANLLYSDPSQGSICSGFDAGVVYQIPTPMPTHQDNNGQLVHLILTLHKILSQPAHSGIQALIIQLLNSQGANALPIAQFINISGKQYLLIFSPSEWQSILISVLHPIIPIEIQYVSGGHIDRTSSSGQVSSSSGIHFYTVDEDLSQIAEKVLLEYRRHPRQQ
ncbi:MAG: homeobox domain-containing protein [Endozoicomonas sp.]